MSKANNKLIKFETRFYSPDVWSLLTAYNSELLLEYMNPGSSSKRHKRWAQTQPHSINKLYSQLSTPDGKALLEQCRQLELKRNILSYNEDKLYLYSSLAFIGVTFASSILFLVFAQPLTAAVLVGATLAVIAGLVIATKIYNAIQSRKIEAEMARVELPQSLQKKVDEDNTPTYDVAPTYTNSPGTFFKPRKADSNYYDDIEEDLCSSCGMY